MISMDELKAMLASILQVGSRLDALGPDDALLGGVPEFDSMAVVTLLTMIEDNYGIAIADDDVSAEHFESLGSLQAFVNVQLA